MENKKSELNNTYLFTQVLGIAKNTLIEDLGIFYAGSLTDYFENGLLNFNKNSLFSHPLALLVIPRPRERYIHPAITDASLYSLRVSASPFESCDKNLNNNYLPIEQNKAKFCLVGSNLPPGYENNLAEDWIGVIFILIYYCLPKLKLAYKDHICENSFCWICLCNYAFENMDTSVEENRGQPINVSLFSEILLATSRIKQYINASKLPNCTIPRGLLSRKLQKISGRADNLLLKDIYLKSDNVFRPNVHWNSRRDINITSNINIKSYELAYLAQVEESRKNLHFNIHHLLSFVLHSLLRQVSDSSDDNYSTKQGKKIFTDKYLKASVTKYIKCPLLENYIVNESKILLFDLNFSNCSISEPEKDPSVVVSSKITRNLNVDDVSNVSNDFPVISNNFISESISLEMLPEESLKALSFHNVNQDSTKTSYDAPVLSPQYPFCRLLTESFNKKEKFLMHCNNCTNSYPSLHEVITKVTVLPEIICIKTDNHFVNYWRGPEDLLHLSNNFICASKNKNWKLAENLRKRILESATYTVLPEYIHVKETKNEKNPLKNFEFTETAESDSLAKYELIAVVFTINNDWNRDIRAFLERLWSYDFSKNCSSLNTIEIEEGMIERPTIVDQTMIYLKLQNETNQDDNWILINGPLSASVSCYEVRNFAKPYKFPVAFFYKKSDLIQSYLDKIQYKRDSLKDLICPTNLSQFMIKMLDSPFAPLSFDEINSVERGHFKCAFDSEYVVKSYISKSPDHLFCQHPQYMIARATAIRANNLFDEKESLLFMDHYVKFNEHPTEYRTKFSGIMPGNLHVSSSTKWLVDLKTIYRFVRALVIRNCQFIGHDLFNDFRVLGMIVPRKLIIDTVELFRLNMRSRFLSLRYLIWAVFDQKIQKDTHSSIEDAKASLNLYRYFLDYVTRYSELSWRNLELTRIYNIGKNTGYKIPN